MTKQNQTSPQSSTVRILSELELFKPLSESIEADLKSAISLRDNGNNREYHTRTYVRTAFSGIEASLNFMVTWALSFVEVTQHNLPIAIGSLLRGEKYSIKGAQIKTGNSPHLSVPDLIALVDSAYSELLGNQIKIDRGGQQWQDFDESLKIRHRITHPQRASDLNINDDEFRAIKDSVEWIIEHLTTVIC